MQKDFILSHVDHTMLKQGATWADIQRICDEGLSHRTASVCIPPSYVADAAAYLKGQLAVCTVIGFPNGYQTTAVKVAETKDAIAHGADEIDMVINIGWVKDGKDQKVLEEINAVKEACQGRILKVIVETCLLTEEEKSVCVMWSAVLRQNTSRQAQDLLAAVLHLQMWSCLRSMYSLVPRSKRQAASKVLQTRKNFWNLAQSV